ncbi:MAG: hypothetical protein JSR62_09525 [Nitrospira sp.]|nr:hypothetical protein [Nitrospira sp.]
MAFWIPQLHAALGGLVLAVGIVVMWKQAVLIWALLVGLLAAGLLLWKGRSIGAVWAWTTLGLGVESMAWPIVTMVQMRMAGGQPTEEQMETILNAVIFGLFTSVFWVTFAFGLFKRVKEQQAPPAPVTASPSSRKKSKRARA